MDSYNVYLVVSHIYGSRIHRFSMVKNKDATTILVKRSTTYYVDKISNHSYNKARSFCTTFNDA